MKIKIAIQKQGRLTDKSIKFLQSAGLEFKNGNGELISQCKDKPISVVFMRDDDIPNLENMRIATSYPRLLAEYLRSQNIKSKIVYLSGSVEMAVCRILQTCWKAAQTRHCLQACFTLGR